MILSNRLSIHTIYMIHVLWTHFTLRQLQESSPLRTVPANTELFLCGL